jgi:RimJ/RimL family protein N-acetyltransferase
MLQGERVRLRPIERDDLPNYVVWINDPDVLAYFGTYLPMNLAQETAWFESMLNDPNVLNFAIEYEGRHVGGAGFNGIRWRHQSAEVGLFIGEKALWGRGLGQDTLRTLLDYGFNQLNFHRIYLRVFAEHARAVRSYEALGFVHEGRLRQAEWRHGRWQDILIMSILRHEWRSTTP